MGRQREGLLLGLHGADCPAGEKAEHAGHMGDEIAGVTMSQGSM